MTSFDQNQDLQGNSGPRNDNRPDFMLKTVQAWKDEDIYITKSVKAVMDKISSIGCVCVIGVPGAGKSTALHHAAISLEEKEFIIYFISGPDEFLQYYDKDMKQGFVLDDALGIYSVSRKKVDSWQENDEKVRNTLGPTTKLLVSIRTQIVSHETIKHRKIVFLETSLTTDHVNFSDTDYKMGTDEMRDMLKHYMTSKECNIDEINKLITQLWPYTEEDLANMTEEDRQNSDMSLYDRDLEFSDFYPLLCNVFVKTDSVRKHPKYFLNIPFRHWKMYFNI